MKSSEWPYFKKEGEWLIAGPDKIFKFIKEATYSQKLAEGHIEYDENGEVVYEVEGDQALCWIDSDNIISWIEILENIIRLSIFIKNNLKTEKAPSIMNIIDLHSILDTLKELRSRLISYDSLKSKVRDMVLCLTEEKNQTVNTSNN